MHSQNPIKTEPKKERTLKLLSPCIFNGVQDVPRLLLSITFCTNLPPATLLKGIPCPLSVFPLLYKYDSKPFRRHCCEIIRAFFVVVDKLEMFHVFFCLLNVKSLLFWKYVGLNRVVWFSFYKKKHIFALANASMIWLFDWEPSLYFKTSTSSVSKK